MRLFGKNFAITILSILLMSNAVANRVNAATAGNAGSGERRFKANTELRESDIDLTEDVEITAVHAYKNELENKAESEVSRALEFAEYIEAVLDLDTPLPSPPAGVSRERQARLMSIREILIKAKSISYKEKRFLRNDTHTMEGNEFSQGSGSFQDPYVITSPAELALIRFGLDQHYILGNCFHLSDYGSWQPIGDDEHPFTGSFDGNGNAIYSLETLNREEDYQGLFGHTGPTAIVKDLSLEFGRVRGHDYVGILVGWNEGQISDCMVSGTAEGVGVTGGLVGINFGLVNKCQASVTVVSGNYHGADGSHTGCGGGIVGLNLFGGSITSCRINGSVQSDSIAGGIVGYCGDGILQSCTVTGGVAGGEYVGGIVGIAERNTEEISNCSYIGPVGGSNECVGGLIGYASGGGMRDCSVYSTTEGEDYTGGAVGLASGEGRVRLENIQFTGNVTGGSYTGGLVGLVAKEETTFTGCQVMAGVKGEDSVGGLVGLLSGTAPANIAECTYRGDVEGLDYCGGFLGLANGGQISDSLYRGNVSGANCTGGFVGQFSGSGNCLNYLTYVGNVVGLDFVGGFVGFGTGEIINSTFCGKVEGGDHIGGLAGHSLTTVNSTFSGEISGDNYVGGLAGIGYGYAVNCKATAQIDSHGQYAIGGLVGYNYGIVCDSIASVDVCAIEPGAYGVGGAVGINDGSVLRSLVFGTVESAEYAGGIVGCNNQSIGNCIALNNSVILLVGDHYNLGRVAAQNFGTLAMNFASKDMVLTAGSESYVPISARTGKDGEDIGAKDYNKLILGFSLPNQLAPAWIDIKERTVCVPLANTTRVVKKLAAEFQLSLGAIAYANDSEQVSGKTANDFSSQVVYAIVSEDGSKTAWAVRVIDEAEYNHYYLATLGRAIACTFFNDSVNVVTGNFFETETDISSVASGVPLEFTRSYNSQDKTSGPLGPGWQHNYNSYLTVIGGDKSISLRYPDGSRALFRHNGGLYTAQPGIEERLVKNLDNSFTLCFKDGTRYCYDGNGRLKKIVAEDGSLTALNYSGTLLTRVTSSGNASLEFTYDAEGRLRGLTGPGGEVRYEYHEGSLASVVDANGKATFYEYEPEGLVAIADGLGNKTTENEYDEMSRVILQRDGQGKTTTYCYDPVNYKTTAIYPAGDQVTFYYDIYCHITAIEQPAGFQPDRGDGGPEERGGLRRYHTVTIPLISVVDGADSLATRAGAAGKAGGEDLYVWAVKPAAAIPRRVKN